VGTVAKSIVERGQMYTPDAQLYARTHSMLETVNTISKFFAIKFSGIQNHKPMFT
jgi:hypothetical protein